jgi:hypothetical protein
MNELFIEEQTARLASGTFSSARDLLSDGRETFGAIAHYCHGESRRCADLRIV